MTSLREKAEAAAALRQEFPPRWDLVGDVGFAITDALWQEFEDACDPTTILALLDVVEAAKAYRQRQNLGEGNALDAALDALPEDVLTAGPWNTLPPFGQQEVRKG